MFHGMNTWCLQGTSTWLQPLSKLCEGTGHLECAGGERGADLLPQRRIEQRGCVAGGQGRVHCRQVDGADGGRHLRSGHVKSCRDCRLSPCLCEFESGQNNYHDESASLVKSYALR